MVPLCQTGILPAALMPFFMRSAASSVTLKKAASKKRMTKLILFAKP